VAEWTSGSGSLGAGVAVTAGCKIRFFSRLLLFVAVLAMTVVFSGSVWTGDRTGMTRARPTGSATSDLVTAAGPGPVAGGVGASRVMEVGGGAVSQSVRGPRKKPRCLECAIVDSVHQSNRPERAVGSCPSGPWPGHLAGVGVGEQGAYDLGFALRAIAAPVMAVGPGSMPRSAAFTYRIVVRLADGSRIVFNEPTARTLQAGDRIVVIAGASAGAP
jgi:hypothetical protein